MPPTHERKMPSVRAADALQEDSYDLWQFQLISWCQGSTNMNIWEETEEGASGVLAKSPQLSKLFTSFPLRTKTMGFNCVCMFWKIVRCDDCSYFMKESFFSCFLLSFAGESWWQTEEHFELWLISYSFGKRNSLCPWINDEIWKS